MIISSKARFSCWNLPIGWTLLRIKIIFVSWSGSFCFSKFWNKILSWIFHKIFNWLAIFDEAVAFCIVLLEWRWRKLVLLDIQQVQLLVWSLFVQVFHSQTVLGDYPFEMVLTSRLHFDIQLGTISWDFHYSNLYKGSDTKFSYEDNPGSNSCWINSVKLVIGLMNDVDDAGISEN